MTEPAFTKIAVTVPTRTFAVVERLRQKLGRSRSAVVALALEDWIRSADLAEADRRYVEGYLRTPEAVDEIRAVAAQATAQWAEWPTPESPREVRRPAGRRARRKAKQLPPAARRARGKAKRPRP